MYVTKFLKIAIAAASITQIASLSMSSTTSSTSTTTHNPHSSLGGNNLRQMVITAARHDVSETMDLNGIMWFEHINLLVGSKPLAERFYLDFLGLTNDASKSFHLNLGQQQFHLAENGEPAQRVTGSIGMVVPNLDTLRKRADAAYEDLKDTQFEIMDDDDAGCMTITCPWGNSLHLYDARDDNNQKSGSESSFLMVKMHSDGDAYGAHRMTVRGNPGIRYLEVICRTGTSLAIARFYEEMLGCTVSTSTSGHAIVCIGPGVHLVYVEDERLSNSDVKQMEGVHVCIYVNDFKGLYNRLASRDLIWTNPRFLYLDSCDTWEEAMASRTLRFKDIIDLSTGERILELEHETRSLRHGQYLKVPKYEPK